MRNNPRGVIQFVLHRAFTPSGKITRGRVYSNRVALKGANLGGDVPITVEYRSSFRFHRARVNKYRSLLHRLILQLSLAQSRWN